ncbi:hypothetical protein B0H10DRAFT_1751533, partial [Mycena sp. CBHHK59/15]
PSDETPAAPLQQFGAYPFATDDEYQNGLASILAGGALDGDPPDDIREEILRRTRVFYFNRVTGNAITMDEARAYEQTRYASSASDPPPMPIPPSADGLPILSFAQLQALIESGRADEIPNNRIIPEDLNDAPPSTSTAPARRKPWE